MKYYSHLSGAYLLLLHPTQNKNTAPHGDLEAENGHYCMMVGRKKMDEQVYVKKNGRASVWKKKLITAGRLR